MLPLYDASRAVEVHHPSVWAARRSPTSWKWRRWWRMLWLCSSKGCGFQNRQPLRLRCKAPSAEQGHIKEGRRQISTAHELLVRAGMQVVGVHPLVAERAAWIVSAVAHPLPVPERQRSLCFERGWRLCLLDHKRQESLHGDDVACFPVDTIRHQ